MDRETIEGMKEHDMGFTKNEIQALSLFNEFKSSSVAIGLGNPKKLVPPDVAESLHRKGTVTIAIARSKGHELEANLTPYGKTVCVGLLMNNEFENPEETVRGETISIKQSNESTNEKDAKQEWRNEMFKCVCGKEAKSKSGFTLHQKNCEVYQNSVESNSERGAVPTVEEKVEKPEPVVVPPMVVPIGVEIILSGEVWCKEPSDESYCKKIVDDVVVKTVVRMPVVDGVWIICQADGSQTMMAVGENDVLDGKYPKVSVEEKMEIRNTEMEKDRESFLGSTKRYVEARDQKLKMEKAFKAVDKDERPVLEGYARKYGKESGAGKLDFQVLDSGYNVHLVRTPGKPVTKYKEEDMVKWLIDNGHHNCLKQVVDINMWNNLKLSKVVPPDVISSVEDITMTNDTYSLTVKIEKRD